MNCLTINSLSHHQLLFVVFIYATNMEIVFTKSKQNDIFTCWLMSEKLSELSSLGQIV